mmetsp:Transcript_7599/g.23040  ORF Transcript_7599/g.23040 Transcript_7599/m.23040 type:complete len:261 (-) Transcript_7599:116-898(-)
MCLSETYCVVSRTCCDRAHISAQSSHSKVWQSIAQRHLPCLFWGLGPSQRWRIAEISDAVENKVVLRHGHLWNDLLNQREADHCWHFQLVLVPSLFHRAQEAVVEALAVAKPPTGGVEGDARDDNEVKLVIVERILPRWIIHGWFRNAPAVPSPRTDVGHALCLYHRHFTSVQVRHHRQVATLPAGKDLLQQRLRVELQRHETLLELHITQLPGGQRRAETSLPLCPCSHTQPRRAPRETSPYLSAAQPCPCSAPSHPTD